MRWDALFEDLEAQAAALVVAERSAEIEERTRSEFGRLSIAERVAAAIGSQLSIGVHGGLRVSGQLRRGHAEWLLLAEPHGREVLVAMRWVATVAGLGRLSAPGSGGPVTARLGLRHLLRGIARDRSGVRMHLADGEVLEGTLDRVGADFVELARHAPGEARRRAAVLDVQAVRTDAIAAVRRDG
jgi:hypothetical protein